jgi:hypothetical protein
MFKIEIDTKALVERLDHTRNRIIHFKRVDLGAELSAWQTEELNRHRPFTMRWRAQGRAQTKIRPHSLYEMMESEGEALTDKQRRRAMKGLRTHLRHPITRKQRARLLHPREHRRWSMRPILRQEMERRLIERMRQAAEEKIHW